jgi:hypothetical protein
MACADPTDRLMGRFTVFDGDSWPGGSPVHRYFGAQALSRTLRKAISERSPAG